MKVKKLFWAPSKTYRSGGKNYRISIQASLDDECHNMTCDFSITGNVYKQNRNGVWEHYTGGCIHDVIVRHPGVEEVHPPAFVELPWPADVPRG